MPFDRPRAAGRLARRKRNAARSLLLSSCLFVLAAFLLPDDARAEERREGRGARAWTVHLDNDLFAFAERDRDYTAGVAFTLVDDRPATRRSLPSKALDWLDGKTRIAALHRDDRTDTRVLEAGLLLFSPNDLTSAEPLHDDRPYANLSYVASSRVTHEPGSRLAHQSSLTLGMLGLPVVESLHRGVHSRLGGDVPRGYAHQIADGGEPTFRYAFTRHRLLANGDFGGRAYSVRFGAGGSLGYLTEAAAELELRWGRADIPWWSAATLSSDYGGHPSVTLPTRAGDRFRLLFDAGVTVRARYYNAFLQGQVRDSVVTYASAELDHLLWEVWLGVMSTVRDNITIAYTIRHQSGEIHRGPGARNLTWASVVVSHRFG